MNNEPFVIKLECGVHPISTIINGTHITVSEPEPVFKNLMHQILFALTGNFRYRPMYYNYQIKKFEAP